MKFSVLLSVYKNEDVSNFCSAMDSILSQTLKPNEIILVRDGEVPNDLEDCIKEYIENNDLIKYIPLEKNVGLGNALNIGLQHVSFNLVARMDTDDICEPTRFERQIQFFEENPEVTVVGGQIKEFVDDIGNCLGERKVPCSHYELKEFIKTRCPINHMTVMFKKQAVMEVGNYIEVHFVEDYYLWCRLYVAGYKFANLPQTLVYARVNENTYKRRGGLGYYKSFKILEKYKYEHKLTSWLEYRKALFIRFMQAIVPNWLRAFTYKKVLRKGR